MLTLISPFPPPSFSSSRYQGLEYGGNTSINPFFYGTYLAETKPEEPVLRTKLEAYQADAVGAMHQLSQVHFERMHTYRLEWQPGRGGSIDWYVKKTDKNAKKRPGKKHFAPIKEENEANGSDDDWIHAYSIKDKSLEDASGAQVPSEPSYLVFNTAVSSTWGFPDSVPSTCVQCFDCNDPSCACALPPGFCDSLRGGKTNMLIDSVRVYQSDDHEAHAGEKHSVGCDPVDHPTREYIKGHEYRYVRPSPFEDFGKSLKKLRAGGGECELDTDCGSTGKCVSSSKSSSFFSFDKATISKSCKCLASWIGPNCLSQNNYDEQSGSYDLSMNVKWFSGRFVGPHLPVQLILGIITIVCGFVGSFYMTLQKKKGAGAKRVGD